MFFATPCTYVLYKVSENPTDELEYWLSPESSAGQPTTGPVATLPDSSDTTKQRLGPESVEHSEKATSVSWICSVLLARLFMVFS